MKLVMTLMVRDEADIIRPMLEHHLAQGVDMVIATDNGSTDGTLEILEEYRDRGVVDLRTDPRHMKQQGVTVTTMARDAFTAHGADWVINADADEFWVPKDRTSTLHRAFEGIAHSIGAFDVPVYDMIGAPAQKGTGLDRLVYRDLRSTKRLLEVGLLSHSTHDCAHIGSPDVEVSQGNHFVNIPSAGRPAPENRIEVLHVPWRSWEQYSGKVERAGRAYEASHLTPSPNHHGMRDYRRLLDGTLYSLFIARHPGPEELAEGLATGELVEDRVLAGLSGLGASDISIPEEECQVHRRLGEVIARLQNEVRYLTIERDARDYELGLARLENQHRLNEEESLRTKLAETSEVLATYRNRRIVRAIDRVAHRRSP